MMQKQWQAYATIYPAYVENTKEAGDDSNS